MSRLLIEFHCVECDTTFDDLVQSETRQLACVKCGATALRQISVPHFAYSKMATSGDGFPTAIDKFDKAHRERKAIEERKYREHGDYGSAAGSDGGVSTPEKQSVLD